MLLLELIFSDQIIKKSDCAETYLAIASGH